MKGWQLVLVLLAVGAVGFAHWCFRSDSAKPVKPGFTVSETRKKPDGGLRRVESPARPKDGWRMDGGASELSIAEDDAELGFNFGGDFAFEDEITERLSPSLQALYDQLVKASREDDSKAMLRSIRAIMAQIDAGAKVPSWLKSRVISDLSWVGGGMSSVPELTTLLADEDPMVATSALSALQELLWDFDTTPQQIADALKQVVAITDDRAIISQFVSEMADLPTDLKVSSALAIIDSGNTVAQECLDYDKAFIFDDFDDKLRSREDIVQYGIDHAEGEE